MSAWYTEDQLQDQFNDYLKSEYGDSDGDFSIENSYYNVVTILEGMGDYDDKFENWRDEQDDLHQHPRLAYWTRDADLADYADTHPDNDDVVEWDSIDEAPSDNEDDLKFDDGDTVWVIDPNHSAYGKQFEIEDTDPEGRSSGAYYGRVDGEAFWFNEDQVSENQPDVTTQAPPIPTESPFGAPAPSAPPADETYPTLNSPRPLNIDRLWPLGFKVEATGDLAPYYKVGDTGVVDGHDINDPRLTYIIKWDSDTQYNRAYAHNSHLKPATSDEQVQAETLRRYLERSKTYLEQRTGTNDTEWANHIRNVYRAYKDYGVTEEMVQTIADALRPPKSHSAAISIN